MVKFQRSGIDLHSAAALLNEGFSSRTSRKNRTLKEGTEEQTAIANSRLEFCATVYSEDNAQIDCGGIYFYPTGKYEERVNCATVDDALRAAKNLAYKYKKIAQSIDNDEVVVINYEKKDEVSSGCFYKIVAPYFDENEFYYVIYVERTKDADKKCEHWTQTLETLVEPDEDDDDYDDM